MKRILILSVLVFYATLSVSAQDAFSLTPSGFTSTLDPSKDFIVLDAQGEDQAALFQKTLVYLSTVFRSPQDVISKVENETITINGIEKEAIRRNKLGHNFDINYSIVFRFKDGKVRIDAPFFELTTFTDKKQTLHLVWTKMNLNGSDLGIYGKDDKIKSELAKSDLEEFFNKFIGKYEEELKSAKNSDW